MKKFLLLIILGIFLLPLSANAEAVTLTEKDGVYRYTGWPFTIIYTGASCGYSDKCTTDPDKLPPLIDKIRKHTLSAIAKEIHSLGFNHPANQQGEYITIIVEDGGWVEDKLPAGVAGLAKVIDGTPVMIIDGGLDGGALESTIAHEMFHLIQFSYDPSFAIGPYTQLNFSEGTAEWMERLLFELDKYWINQNYKDFFKAYYRTPHKSLLGTNGTDKSFQYGTVLWPIYLETEYGEEVIKEIWENYFIEVSSTGKYFNALYFATDKALKNHASNIETAYRGFTGWLYDKDQYRRNIEDFPDMNTYDVSSIPTEWLQLDGVDKMPQLLGSVYIKFKNIDNSKDFYLSVLGASDTKWSVDFYSHSTGSNYKSKVSGTIPLGNVKSKEFKVDKRYLGNELVAIISPINSDQLQAEDKPFDFYYPFQFKASYQSDGVQPAVAPLVKEITKPTTNIFIDISSDNKNANAISYLKKSNVINGYSDGSFKPENTVNRAELLKILIGNKYDTTGSSNCFQDVKDEWFAPYVCYAKGQGWVEGYFDKTFKPAQTVNRAEAIKMAIEVLGIELPKTLEVDPFIDVNKDAWFAPYVYAAKKRNCLEGSSSNYQPTDGMTRGDVSEIIYRLLVIQKMQVDEYQSSLDESMLD